MKTGETVVCRGLAFPEGPCVGPEGDLYFVELARGCISRSRKGERSVISVLGGSPNGAAFGPGGALYVCNGGGNWPPTPSTAMQAGLDGAPPRLERLFPDGSVETLVTAIDGVSLNAPNDLCFDAGGGLYFTDPAWAERDSKGVAAADASPPGSLCYWTPGAGARRLHTGLLFPNGVQVSADDTTLFVAETGTGRIHAFRILSSGVLGEPRIFCDLGASSRVDGMCLDASGRIYVAGCTSSTIFVIEQDGRLSCEITVSDPSPTNVCFGGADLKTLYISAGWNGALLAIRGETPSLPPYIPSQG